METDQKLIAAANSGDSQAFEMLYLRYRDWVYALAMRFTGNAAQTADVVQETFLYLLKKFPGFELRTSMKSFLYPAVRHIAVTIARQSRRTMSDEELLRQAPARQPDVAADHEDLAAALAGLPPDQHQVVLMRFVDDMSLAESAAALDLPLNTIKARLYRALQALRDDPRTRRYFLA